MKKEKEKKEKESRREGKKKQIEKISMVSQPFDLNIISIPKNIGSDANNQNLAECVWFVVVNKNTYTLISQKQKKEKTEARKRMGRKERSITRYIPTRRSQDRISLHAHPETLL